MNSWIHWHEGLFLQPHHLQRLQRGLFESSSTERRLQWAYPFGIISLRISEDELANRRLRLERLRAVMRSGLWVDFPDHATIATLDLKEALARHKEGFVVSLAVPQWDDQRANTLEGGQVADARVKLLYCVEERNIRDENTGENPRPVAYRKVNARLVLPGEDITNMETLPIARVMPGVGENIGQAQLDPTFAPPCLVVQGSAAMRKLAYDLANQVEASRNSLSIQINQGGFSLENMRGMQFEQMLRLRTLNRYSARLPILAESAHVPPVELYMELHSLLGELNALNPREDVFRVSPFNHEEPMPGLRELETRIRGFLKGAVKSSYLKVEFRLEGDFLAASMEDSHFTQPNDYFLGIATREEHRAVTSLVEDPDRFKLMAASMIKRPIFGVKLKEERIPPMELPAQSNLHYYRILRSESGRMWQMMEREKEIALRWPGLEGSDFKVTLYMTVPG